LFQIVSDCSLAYPVVSLCFIISPKHSKTCRAVVSKITRVKYAPLLDQTIMNECELW